MPSAPVCIMENEAGSEYLFKKCSRKPLLQGDLSHHGVKEKYQPLYQKLVLNMVRVVIQHFSKNTVISMVLGHPNSEITCIPPS